MLIQPAPVYIPTMNKTLVNIRYAFLPIPVVLGVYINAEEWRTLPILSAALHQLSNTYGPEIKNVWLADIPSPLLAKLTIPRQEEANVGTNPNDIILQSTQSNEATELTDIVLREAGGLAEFAKKHGDVIIDLCERKTIKRDLGTPLVRCAMALLLFVGLYMYSIGDVYTILRGAVFSMIGGWFTLPWACKCKVVVR